jgi:hypothetical protein
MDPVTLIQTIVDDSTNENMDPIELIWNCSSILKWTADGGSIFPFNSRELANIVSLALSNSISKMEKGQ